jgi:L-iditol 2-dehydrogenase
MAVVELPRPAVGGESDVLLKVAKVGVCGSDLHYYQTGRIGTRVVQFPFVLGHECAGTVVEIGRGVKRVRPGEEVAVDPAMSCGQCDQCRRGRPHTCRRLKFLGGPDEVPGCLSEFIVMPQDCLYPTNGRISLEQAALCEPLSIGVYAVKQAQLAPRADVAILGCGPIGLCVLLAARHAGAAAAFATDRLDHRLSVAAKLGAGWTGNPDKATVVNEILARQPAGMDVVFECAGQQETLDQAVQLLKPGGRLMVIGIPTTERVSFRIDALRRKEITLLNVRRQNHCVETAIELVASRSVNVDCLVTHRFAPEDAQRAFDLVAAYGDGVVKALIEFG